MADTDTKIAGTGEGTPSAGGEVNWEDRYKNLEKMVGAKSQEDAELKRQNSELASALTQTQQQIIAMQQATQPRPAQLSHEQLEELKYSDPDKYAELRDRQLEARIYQNLAPILQQTIGSAAAVKAESEFYKRYPELDNPELKDIVYQEADRIVRDPALARLSEDEKYERVAQASRLRARQKHEALSKWFTRPDSAPHLGGGSASGAPPMGGGDDDKPVSAETVLSDYLNLNRKERRAPK